MYLYETHCHCSRCSLCARSSPQELVLAYHRAGYAGMVLTDHFIFGNTAVDRGLPWEAQMQCYYDAFLEAKQLGDELDFDVIFGIEHAYGDGKEVLIYGIGLDFLLVNPDIPSLSLDELVQRVHEAGGLVIQAHPYRDRYYVNMAVPPRSDIVDGIEIYNSGNRPGEDRKAFQLAQTGSYILTSGGDVHFAEDPKLGQAGILLPHRVRNHWEFAAALKKSNLGWRICGQDIMHLREELFL